MLWMLLSKDLADFKSLKLQSLAPKILNKSKCELFAALERGQAKFM